MSNVAPGSLLKTAPAPQSHRAPVKTAAPKLLNVRLLSVTAPGSLINRLAVLAITVEPPPPIAPPDQVKLLVVVKLELPPSTPLLTTTVALVAGLLKSASPPLIKVVPVTA